MAPVPDAKRNRRNTATAKNRSQRKRVNLWLPLPEADDWGQFFMTRSLHEDDGHRRCGTSMSRLMTPA